MDKIKKFLLKLTKKEKELFKAIMADIRVLNLKSYDVKPLKGYKEFYRLRKGNVRIVFMKKDNLGIVFDIDFRKNIYKN